MSDNGGQPITLVLCDSLVHDRHLVHTSCMPGTVFCCSSLAKLHLTLRPYELQHTRLPCPSLFPGVCSNSCSLSQWCRPTVSFSVALVSCFPQSFPSSGSFPVSQLLASGGQRIGASVSASVFAMNIQGWSLVFTDLISLHYKGLSRVFSSTTIRKHQFFNA